MSYIFLHDTIFVITFKNRISHSVVYDRKYAHCLYLGSGETNQSVQWRSKSISWVEKRIDQFSGETNRAVRNFSQPHSFPSVYLQIAAATCTMLHFAFVFSMTADWLVDLHTLTWCTITFEDLLHFEENYFTFENLLHFRRNQYWNIRRFTSLSKKYSTFFLHKIWYPRPSPSPSLLLCHDCWVGFVSILTRGCCSNVRSVTTSPFEPIKCLGFVGAHSLLQDFAMDIVILQWTTKLPWLGILQNNFWTRWVISHMNAIKAGRGGIVGPSLLLGHSGGLNNLYRQRGADLDIWEGLKLCTAIAVQRITYNLRLASLLRHR